MCESELLELVLVLELTATQTTIFLENWKKPREENPKRRNKIYFGGSRSVLFPDARARRVSASICSNRVYLLHHQPFHSISIIIICFCCSRLAFFFFLLLCFCRWLVGRLVFEIIMYAAAIDIGPKTFEACGEHAVIYFTPNICIYCFSLFLFFFFPRFSFLISSRLFRWCGGRHIGRGTGRERVRECVDCNWFRRKLLFSTRINLLKYIINDMEPFLVFLRNVVFKEIGIGCACAPRLTHTGHLHKF